MSTTAEDLGEGGRRLIQAERQAAREARREARALRRQLERLEPKARSATYWRRRARDAEADAARLRTMLAASATTPHRKDTP